MPTVEGLRDLLPIDELVRVARLLDEDGHCEVADRAAARWGAGSAVFFRSSASHVFVAGDLVLRLAPAGTPQGRAVARSAGLATELVGLGAPVPPSVASLSGLLVEEVDDLVATAQPRVPGTTYDDDELDPDLATLWGRTLARFHHTGYVHGDPEPDNLVVGDHATATFVDLDDAGPGDPVADIAFALRAWSPLGDAPDLTHDVPTAFLQGYREEREVDVDALAAAAREVARRTLASYRAHLTRPADPAWPEWAIALHTTITQRAEALARGVPD